MLIRIHIKHMGVMQMCRRAALGLTDGRGSSRVACLSLLCTSHSGHVHTAEALSFLTPSVGVAASYML